MRSSVWKLHFRRSKLQLAWFVLFFSLFPTHLVQSLDGQQLPSHIPLIKIGGQSRVVAGVTLKGGRWRFSGVLTAGGAHGRGGGGLVPRTGCRGRIRPLGFVHLKPRGRDGSELKVPTLLSWLGMLPLAGGTLGPGIPCLASGQFMPCRSPCVLAANACLGSRPLHCSVPARGAAATGQAAFAQPSSTEPCSGNWVALAMVSAQKETTPFPRAVLQPRPRHQGLLGHTGSVERCDRHRSALLCPARGKEP